MDLSAEGIFDEDHEKKKAHLEWCKARAMDYAKVGDGRGCAASMMSDLMKWPGVPLIKPEALLRLSAIAMTIQDPADLIHWVEGFQCPKKNPD